jgi:hypothetical protein
MEQGRSGPIQGGRGRGLGGLWAEVARSAGGDQAAFIARQGLPVVGQ